MFNNSPVSSRPVTDASVAAAGAVMEEDYDANTILAANADDTPLPLTVAVSSILGRAAAGNIDDLTPAQVRTIIDFAVQARDAINNIFGADGLADADINLDGNDLLDVNNGDFTGILRTEDTLVAGDDDNSFSMIEAIKDGSYASIGGTSYRNTATPHNTHYYRSSRGTLAIPLIIQTGDEMINILGLGYDGTGFRSAGRISIKSGGTPGVFNMPGKIELATTPSGSTTPLIGIELDNVRNTLLGGSEAGTGGSKTLVIANGTVQTVPPSDASVLYAKDVTGSSELFVVDEAGNETQLSAHAQDAPDWLYDWDIDVQPPNIKVEINRYTGTVRYTNYTRFSRLNQMQILGEDIPTDISKKTIIHTESFEEYNTRNGYSTDDPNYLQLLDWDNVQQGIFNNRIDTINTIKDNKSKIASLIHTLKSKKPDNNKEANLINKEIKRLNIELDSIIIPDVYDIKPKPVWLS